MERFPQNFLKKETTRPEEKKTEKTVIKEGLDFVFEQHPELAKIGSKEQYSQYLATIFPESRVEEIVYHGGTLNETDRGKDSFTGEFGGKHGLYFTGSKNRAKSYIKSGSKEYREKSDVHCAVLDIKNPLDKRIWSRWKFGLDKISDKEFSIIKEQGADGLIEKDFLSKFIQYNTQYVVLEAGQIHLLGSPDDLEEFKKFIENETNTF